VLVALPLQSCPDRLVLPVLFCLSHSGCLVLAASYAYPFLAFLSFLFCPTCLILAVLRWQTCLASPVLAVLLLLSCLGSPVTVIFSGLSRSGGPFLAALFWVSILSRQSRPACPVLLDLFCLSCPACSALPVLFCLSCSVCPVLHVLFCLSCSACPFLPVLFCLSCPVLSVLSCSVCPVQPFLVLPVLLVPVLFILSCSSCPSFLWLSPSGCPVLTFLFWLSYFGVLSWPSFLGRTVMTVHMPLHIDAQNYMCENQVARKYKREKSRSTGVPKREI
jgi:hypothetical protein